MPIFDETFTKDPDEVLKYTRNWSRWLPAADTITSSSWAVSAGTVAIDSNAFSTEAATVWLSGGAEGEVVYVTNTVVTNDGLTGERSFRVIVRER